MFSGVCLSYFCIMWPERHPPPPSPTVFTLSRVSPLKERAESSLTLCVPAGPSAAEPALGTQQLLEAQGIGLTDGIGVSCVSSCPSPPQKKKNQNQLTAPIPRLVSAAAVRTGSRRWWASRREPGDTPLITSRLACLTRGWRCLQTRNSCRALLWPAC